ncbi:UdgX family uracil-DNA binding protein [Thermopolyspora sp. NPDC052614]|uniref:UdgX family uracil-DNA binding protein n=1 Tax=Thermopolyspora sp. NPDC052614 TaxID=3155682 RepID=UPI003416EDBB
MASHSNTGAARFLPVKRDLTELRHAAAGCRGCDLYRNATQTVFGKGPPGARFLLVGEQPGDQEDLRGEPFVGPAGRVLDRALAEAGIDREAVYVTNAVKHFKFEQLKSGQRGKRRIHRKPSVGEIMACRPWLEAEIDAVDPDVVVVLGATAARAVLGPGFQVTRRRGEPVECGEGRLAVATIHPSAILRADDREAAYAGFLADLEAAARAAPPARAR